MWTDGQKGPLFERGYRSHDNIQKNRARVIGSFMCAPLGVLTEVTCPHAMMSPQGGMSRQATLEKRPGDCRAVSSISVISRRKITQTKVIYSNLATQYFANSGCVNIGRCVLWLQRRVCKKRVTGAVLSAAANLSVDRALNFCNYCNVSKQQKAVCPECVVSVCKTELWKHRR